MTTQVLVCAPAAEVADVRVFSGWLTQGEIAARAAFNLRRLCSQDTQMPRSCRLLWHSLQTIPIPTSCSKCVRQVGRVVVLLQLAVDDGEQVAHLAWGGVCVWM